MGPRGDYPFADGEMSRSTLDRIEERAARTDDPAFRKVRTATGTLTVPEHRLLVARTIGALTRHQGRHMTPFNSF